MHRKNGEIKMNIDPNDVRNMDYVSGDLFRDDIVCDWCKEVVDSTSDVSGCGDLCTDCMHDGGYL